MIEFKTYSGNENLFEDGFCVMNNKDVLLKVVIDRLSTDLEEIALTSKHSDVFRTKLGDIKQIQNLNFGSMNIMLAKLIGAEEYEVLNNQYFCKPPNYKMTSAHQDNAYFDSNEDIFTFWIPLQDVDVLNSCMFYVPQSHLNGLVEHKAIGTNVRTRTGKTGYSLYSDVYKNSEFVKVPMKKGQILIHDKNTMHFSSPNLSDDYRIAVTCIMKVTKWK
jgi:ectoine hydroxylase-related dioxygenase (phytanoyl-CoA dioxygenase family)